MSQLTVPLACYFVADLLFTLHCVTLLLLNYQKYVEISMESLTVSCLFLVNAPMRWLHFIYLKRTAYQL